MGEANISPEVVVTIIFGILQLIVAVIALWQQHYLRWENCSEEDETIFNYIAMHTREDTKYTKQYTPSIHWSEFRWTGRSMERV
ncbi:hypothetical protein NXS19_004323 [Fusarium pseudograminearum]|nr:hypothetical protein NXS19_004323 [Fusarium pseudograminearum]